MNSQVENILLKLNESQLRPVLDTEGRVLVIAGAGSGKTRVLTSRIAYLVLEKSVRPSNILAITFTNKAAKEMKDRLSLIINDIDYMWCSTIHSMCVKILRTCIDKIGYTKDFTIYDDSDKEKVIKRICQGLGIESDKYLKNIKNYISEAKNRYQTPKDFANDNPHLPSIEIYYKAMVEYENTLFRSNALDFDDLLVKTVRIFLDFPEVCEYYSKKFEYIHVDEFQDTNRVQFLIVKLLASYHKNLFVVGDDDQSIYGWRGAEISNILDFDKIFKGTKVYKLEQNYRSTKKILNMANVVIAKNVDRRPKELWTENDEGTDIVYFNAESEREEASYVAIQIKNLMAKYGLKYKDFAVLMRVNALSRGFEQEFLKYNLPYKVYGGFKFYERKEIKDLTGYLKFINNPQDNEAFLRIINCPRRGIGEKTINALLAYSAENGYTLYDTLNRVEFVTDINSGAKNKLIEFRKLIFNLQEKALSYNFDDFVKAVIIDSNFMSNFEEDTEENENRKMNVDEFVNSAMEFKKDNVDATLSDFLNSITLSSDTDDINSENAVSLATIHAVKGLEFKCVFICGLEEGIFPISRSINEDTEDEERRLMYVSITRAEEFLYMTRASQRFFQGERKITTPSRYLRDCGLIKERKKVETEHKSSYNLSVYGDEPEASNYGYNSGYAKAHIQKTMRDNEKYNSIDYSKYKPGTKVRHVKFGEGTILVVLGQGASMVADITFKSVGIKRLAVKFAPMEII
jgi:DNA helicase-2/ATP-dependent DNA helicase PcrA